MDVAGAKWYEVPGIWWNTIERLSRNMVGNRQPTDVSLGRYNIVIIIPHNKRQFMNS
jgi:hypothetical protein